MRRCRYDPAAMISECEAHGLRRADIARMAGLARSTVTMLATGERGRNPSAATMDGLQRAAASCRPAGPIGAGRAGR
jgi:transcriptional regulator with XRE-family HTH domain